MAHVKLILLDDVENLGLAGDEVNVAPGYARNYLLPRGLAAKATQGTLRLVESRKTLIAARRDQELADAKALAAKLAGIELSIPMQATEDEQLFGSVTARMPIAQRRAEQYVRNFADLRKFLERNAGQQVMILSFDRKEDLEPLARAAAELGLAINVEAPDFSERNFDVMESKSRRRSVWTPRLPLKAEENRK